MIEMLNGQYIVTNPNLTINDGAGQTITPVLQFVNVNASNGVIHVIDSPLLFAGVACQRITIDGHDPNRRERTSCTRR